MAKRRLPNTSDVQTHSFVKGLNKDSDFTYLQNGMWTHARNATNNTIEGNQGTISNASSNQLCATAGKTMTNTFPDRFIIGTVHLYADKWIIYTVGHNAADTATMSEIGLFEEDSCRYREIVQDACLKFDKRYLIDGAAREMEDCTWQVYWCDGLNPDRFLNIGDPETWPDSTFTFIGQGDINYYTDGVNKILWPGVEWKQDCPPATCIICTDLPNLDCPKIRLAPLMKTPCVKVKPGVSGGTLRNGTYFAVIAYTVKGQKVTDYFSPSNTQPLWHEDDSKNSLEIEISADDENFDEFVLVVVQNINQGIVAKQVGFYSTKTSRVTIDLLQSDLISVPKENIPLQSVVYEKSNSMEKVNSYLLRVAPTGKFDFNYQPLANLIRAKWASVEYPATYYVDGGYKGSYLRDEVYCFFIRWVYDTGDKSASYHIPGRPPRDFVIPGIPGQYEETDGIQDLETLDSTEKIYEVYNTASAGALNPNLSTTLDDGGEIIASGDMGYWESEEIYPDKKPNVWNSSSHCWTYQSDPNNDLCGKKIRHHKFPDNSLLNETMHFKPNPLGGTNADDLKIRLMGVYFENIAYPKDNTGKDIEGIVGYEILRGSREGNKSIVAKGMINNYRTYELKGSAKKGRTGLYANYPFNTIKPYLNFGTLSDQNYRYNDPFIKVPDQDGLVHQEIPSDIISFHSPDAMFTNPYLSTTELKLYGVIKGFSEQEFCYPDQHPEVKLLSDFTAVAMILGGVAEAIVSTLGKRTINSPKLPDDYGKYLLDPQLSTSQTPNPNTYDPQQAIAYGLLRNQPPVPIISPNIVGTTAYNTFFGNYYNSGGAMLDGAKALISGYEGTEAAKYNKALIKFFNQNAKKLGQSQIASLYTVELPKYAYLDPFNRTLGALNHLTFYFSEGADVTAKLIKALTPFRQYALQMKCHGLYDNMEAVKTSSTSRFKIEDSFYTKNTFQDVPLYQNASGSVSYKINNLKRNSHVTLRTKTGPYGHPSALQFTGPKLLDGEDFSLTTLGALEQFGAPSGSPSGALPTMDDPQENAFSLPIGSYYGGLKYRLQNQYGQLNSVKQIPITPCEQKDFRLSPEGPICGTDDPNPLFLNVIPNTPVLFGGDTFINRYTEKNNMFFFYDWLYGQPDGFEYNYKLYQMIHEPKFWANSTSYEAFNLMPTNLFGISTPGTGALPSGFYELDYFKNSSSKYNYATASMEGDSPGLFTVKDAFFYLSVSSIRDFFVESDVLVDFRETTNNIAEKHYDPYRYTDYRSMFNMDPQIITRDNTYLYDYSLSISKAWTQYFSQGNLQNRNYDPDIAKLCYESYPNRIIYSLPQQDASYKDAWKVYLVNNYKDMKATISGVKSFAKSGMFITFHDQSPIIYRGVDTITTDANTELTIGDGGLFAQPPQNISVAAAPFEYGSCQDSKSILSTPAGFFYISQNQGKIFSYASGLNEISQNGMKWWFDTYLPYQLLQDFPDYPYTNNPICGIGCQTLYDNDNLLLYFSKKDYKLKPEFTGQVTYDSAKDVFIIKDRRAGKFKLGDPNIFDDASWTISFDPKSKMFISFHDWHPDLMMPGKNTWVTTKRNQLWKHNNVCNDYCKYYGKNYPFEIELVASTGQNVGTLKSVEYLLESYKRAEYNCFDQFHVLDFNFDEAVIYNSEQVSGLLNLNLMPKNNLPLSLEYPKYNVANPSYDILFSKEEQKYRFNQFWDITKDRGEFPIGAGYPPTAPVIPGSTVLNGNYNERHIWLTKPNGYVRELNATNIDYQKPREQRKRFRHYANFISLKRNISGPVNMIIKMVNTKTQLSQR
tara:strand:- start:15558 stop:20942 length:5385 start_codon:yes stop_codon:yes gene_type:complete